MIHLFIGQIANATVYISSPLTVACKEALKKDVGNEAERTLAFSQTVPWVSLKLHKDGRWGRAAWGPSLPSSLNSWIQSHVNSQYRIVRMITPVHISKVLNVSCFFPFHVTVTMRVNWFTVVHARTAARYIAWTAPSSVRHQYTTTSSFRPPLPPRMAKLCAILGRTDIDFPYVRLRLDRNKARFNFVDREDQIRDILETWLARFIEASSYRMDNPLSVIYSGPGAGKSRFLDELADLP
ncbi:hypothetical protein BC830DRAFT_1217383, partial [Chytriomyces sp. MP71]